MYRMKIRTNLIPHSILSFRDIMCSWVLGDIPLKALDSDGRFWLLCY